jgi:hypothetical protein
MATGRFTPPDGTEVDVDLDWFNRVIGPIISWEDGEVVASWKLSREEVEIRPNVSPGLIEDTFEYLAAETIYQDAAFISKDVIEDAFRTGKWRFVRID